jgi:hypothetical protein
VSVSGSGFTSVPGLLFRFVAWFEGTPASGGVSSGLSFSGNSTGIGSCTIVSNTELSCMIPAGYGTLTLTFEVALPAVNEWVRIPTPSSVTYAVLYIVNAPFAMVLHSYPVMGISGEILAPAVVHILDGSGGLAVGNSETYVTATLLNEVTDAA